MYRIHLGLRWIRFFVDEAFLHNRILVDPLCFQLQKVFGCRPLHVLEEYLKTIYKYGEFDNKMDKPFLEFLSAIADATIVIPIIDACLGVDIITGEVLIDFEIMDLPLPLTLLISVSAVTITATAAGEYVFATGVGEELLRADKKVVDDLVEHLDEVDGVKVTDISTDDLLNAVNSGKIPDIDMPNVIKPSLDDSVYQEWLKRSSLGQYVPPGMTEAEYKKFLLALEKVDETSALN